MYIINNINIIIFEKIVSLLESTKTNFLNSLPKNTVKDGYVIDIRKTTKDILFVNIYI